MPISAGVRIIGQSLKKKTPRNVELPAGQIVESQTVCGEARTSGFIAMPPPRVVTMTLVQAVMTNASVDVPLGLSVYSGGCSGNSQCQLTDALI